MSVCFCHSRTLFVPRMAHLGLLASCLLLLLLCLLQRASGNTDYNISLCFCAAFYKIKSLFWQYRCAIKMSYMLHRLVTTCGCKSWIISKHAKHTMRPQKNIEIALDSQKEKSDCFGKLKHNHNLTQISERERDGRHFVAGLILSRLKTGTCDNCKDCGKRLRKTMK